MSKPRKHWNPRLRRKLAKMVAMQKQIDLMLEGAMRALKCSTDLIDKMTPDYPPVRLTKPPRPRPLCPGAWMYK